MRWTPNCVPKHCYKYIMVHCPDRKNSVFRRIIRTKNDIRRSPNSAFRGDILVGFSFISFKKIFEKKKNKN